MMIFFSLGELGKHLGLQLPLNTEQLLYSLFSSICFL